MNGLWPPKLTVSNEKEKYLIHINPLKINQTLLLHFIDNFYNVLNKFYFQNAVCFSEIFA